MYYAKSVHEVAKELDTTLGVGLAHSTATDRLTKNGYNELPEPIKESLILKFLSEFADPLVILLIVASAVSFFLGEGIDAIAIIVIVIINAIIGFSQEYKAEKAIEALKKMSSSFTKVIRDGKMHKITTRDVALGDVIVLGAGDRVPADARIVECANLEVSEAILTGESLAVKKTIETISQTGIALGDQKNMVFKDTVVTFGRAHAIVTATGAQTEVGKISTLLRDETSGETPLQKEITKIGKNLSIAALGIIILIFGIEILFEQAELRVAFLSAVSLAVAAIPEGLPAVITIVLAVGVTRLAAKRVIIRKLPAVETLGATTHILTDKTGTLTQNRMVVSNIFLLDGSELRVDGKGYEPQGSFTDMHGNTVDPSRNPDLHDILKLGSLCNDAVLNQDLEKNKWDIVGDITEGALIVAAVKAGIDDEKLKADHGRIYEVPFSSDTKTMTTVHTGDLHSPASNMITIIMKGAPESVLTLCELSPQDHTKVTNKIDEYASGGLRSLGFAYKLMGLQEYENIQEDQRDKVLTSHMKFVGIMAQKDPLRLDVKNVVSEAQSAGITTVIVTGDHKLTAFSIAKELGIAQAIDDAMTGEDLAALSPSEFERIVITKRVFARVSPEQKLMLVKAFKKAGHIVAVTGDGVNDAPAIKAADIGISMGIEGTDVSKEASDMILQDDNFTAIVSAIGEGRVVFDNLVKVIRYLVSCNMSEIMIILLSVLMGYPLPLLPIHLLWINLVTDGFPSLALGMEPGEKDIMKRKPRRLSEGILTSHRWIFIILEGAIMGAVAFIAFRISYAQYGIDVARTVTFLTLNCAQLIHALNTRSEGKSLFQMNIWGNKLLLTVFVISIVVQIPVLYSAFGEKIFKATYLNFDQIVLVVSLSLVPFICVEIMKLARRARARKLDSAFS